MIWSHLFAFFFSKLKLSNVCLFIDKMFGKKIQFKNFNFHLFSRRCKVGYHFHFCKINIPLNFLSEKIWKKTKVQTFVFFQIFSLHLLCTTELVTGNLTSKFHFNTRAAAAAALVVVGSKCTTSTPRTRVGGPTHNSSTHILHLRRSLSRSPVTPGRGRLLSELSIMND